MNTPLITEDRAVAREKLRHYRAQLHKKADAEYAAAAEGYEQLAAGRALLNLADCFLSCPLDQKGRPRLAVARADRKVVQLGWNGYTRAVFDTRKNDARNETLRIEVAVAPADNRTAYRSYALVPMIPADVSAKLPLGTARVDTFVLWEVEQWSDTPLGPPPPHDPYLLKHLRGDLYVVLAEWNLTELERAVMAGRARG